MRDPAEVEVDGGVVLHRVEQARDTPDDVISDWLQAQAYTDQPIGRTILGPTERVSAFSRDDLKLFIADHYGPEQMILSSARAVAHDNIVQLAPSPSGHLHHTKRYPVERPPCRGGASRTTRGYTQLLYV